MADLLARLDRITDPDRVAQAVLLNLDRRALHTEVLPDQRSQCLHRAAQRSGEHCAELLGLKLSDYVDHMSSGLD